MKRVLTRAILADKEKGSGQEFRFEFTVYECDSHLLHQVTLASSLLLLKAGIPVKDIISSQVVSLQADGSHIIDPT